MTTDTEWMGKYRKLMEMIIRFGNTYARTSRGEQNYNTSITFSASQIQILEYLLENENDLNNMVTVAEHLGISKSALSKQTKKMVEKGLLERYHTSDNQKNIIVKVSDFGKEIYQLYSEYTYETAFKKMFAVLDDIPDEYLAKFVTVMEIASEAAATDKNCLEDVSLIKIPD